MGAQIFNLQQIPQRRQSFLEFSYKYSLSHLHLPLFLHCLNVTSSEMPSLTTQNGRVTFLPALIMTCNLFLVHLILTRTNFCFLCHRLSGWPQKRNWGGGVMYGGRKKRKVSFPPKSYYYIHKLTEKRNTTTMNINSAALEIQVSQQTSKP